MTVLVYAKHPPYWDGHLAKVAHDMEVAGTPTIRVVQRALKVFFALEGSHRLFLAHEQGHVPKLVTQEEELGEDCDTFWQRVAPTLPCYEFPLVRVLNLSSFRK